MRVALVLFLSLGAVSTARAVPPLSKQAAAHGLDGAPSKVTPQTKTLRSGKVVTTEVMTEWTSPQGRRWEIDKIGQDGKVQEKSEGMQLNNGRYLFVGTRKDSHGRPVSHVTSRWKANGTAFSVSTRYGQRGTMRTSGNGYLQRVTGPGLSDAGPLRYTNGGLGADIPATIKAMAVLAKRLGKPIEVDINAKLVLANPGESAQVIEARARALGAY